METEEALYLHVNRFAKISEAEFCEIIPYFDVLSVDKKEILSHSGSKCEYLFFVASGCLHSFFTDQSGVEKTIKFAIENWWITDFLAFHHQRESEFTTQAVEPSQLLRISHDRYAKMLNAHPVLERYFRNVYEVTYGAALMRMKYIFDYSKEEIFNRFREQFPEFVNRVPQYMMATYLGLTPEYLSKIRSKKLS